MNARDLYLLAVVAELEPNASYTSIAFKTQSPDYFLVPKLRELRHRGFLQYENSRYTLSDGVRETILSADHYDHWL